MPASSLLLPDGWPYRSCGNLERLPCCVRCPHSFGTSLINESNSEALPGEVVSEHDGKQV